MSVEPWDKPNRKPRHDEWHKEPKTTPAANPFVVLNKVLDQLSTRGVGFHNHELFFQELVNLNYPKSTYPPFDILSTGEDSYEIRLALAGFSREDLIVTFQDQVLTISNYRSFKDENLDAYFHKGIGSRDFKQSFPLAEYVEVKDAVMKDGILTISLERKIPEEMKPKTIKIK